MRGDKKKSGGIAVVLIVVLAVLVVGLFALVSFRTSKSADETTEVSETDELMNRDNDANYPSTPREVVKLYNRYVTCLYGADGEELTEEQIRALGTKLRDLYDQELLTANPEETNLLNLLSELTSFRNDGKTLIQANVSSSNDVEYIDVKDADGARVESSYFVKNGNKDFTRTYEQFLLRKDDAGRWKILGFKKIIRSGE